MLFDVLPGWAGLAPFLLATLALNLTPGRSCWRPWRST